MTSRLLAISLVLTALFSALMTAVVFSQRRSFTEGAGRIVFEMGHRTYNLYTVQPNSSFGEQIRLVFNPQYSFDDRFVTGVDCAPNTEALIFWYIFLYRYDIADYNLTRLVVGDGLHQQSVWSPDGAQIAYLDNLANGPDRDIFTVRADGTEKRQITSDSAQETSLSWSPDGTKIAYSYRLSPVQREHTLAVVDLNTRAITPLYTAPDRIGDVSWSPDGQRIAFSMADGASSHIYTIQPDGEQFLRLTSATRSNIMPRWSPDGSLISFSASSPGEPYRLYVMSAEGGAPYLVFLGVPGEDVFNRCWLRQPTAG